MLSFLNRDHLAKKEALRQQAEHGFPVTSTPYFPSVLVYSVDTKTFGEHAKIILTGKESKYVQKKSLKFIWEFLVDYFKAPYFPRSMVQELQELKSQFPSNTLAVSFAMRFFKVGQRCTDFEPIKEPSEQVYYTYQRISESLQVTYMNLNGKEYLAGICYYPAVSGSPKMISLDKKLLFMKFACSNQYLPGCKRPSSCFAAIQYYSRKCGIAGKSVVVDFKNPERGVCHKEIDFSKVDAYKYTKCAECAEEFEKYDWMWPDAIVTAPVPETNAPGEANKTAELKNPRKKRLETLINDVRVGSKEENKVNKATEDAELNNEPTLPTTDPLGVTTFLESLTAQIVPADKIPEQPKRPSRATKHLPAKADDSKTASLGPADDSTIIPAQSSLQNSDLSQSLQSLINLELDLRCEVKPLERRIKPLRTNKLDSIDASVASPRTLIESDPAQALSLLESVIADADIPCEGPEEVCPFTPTKPLMETDPAQALRILESVIADSDVSCEGPEDLVCPMSQKPLLETNPAQALNLLEESIHSVGGSIFDEVQQDDDTQSSASSEAKFYSCSSSPVTSPEPSGPSDFSEHSPPTSSMESLLEELDEIEADIRETKSKAKTDQDLEVVISSASSTESLMEGYDNLEEGITDLDSDIEIVIDL